MNDPRYGGTDIGVFEGAFEYRYGVWRPSSTSIMDSSGDHFNAPSRNAIYNRIHKLAYGYDWEYDYESFVQYDIKNIEVEKSSIAPASIVSHNSIVTSRRWTSTQIRNTTNEDGKKVLTIIMD